jgi:EAL domain-containing protein (putative c-di-GMP-specific phosphodiesterase class I)
MLPIAEAEVRRLLADETALAVDVQPVVDLRRGLTVGFEALARFQLETPLPPDVVFECALHYGLDEALETVVLERALSLACATPVNCFFAINVDPMHLLSDCVFDAIVAHRDLSGVVFELTEQRRLLEPERVVARIAELRRLGAFTAVDDTGAGYSGLQQILALRPQFLKLDRALVCSIDKDEAKRATVEMLGELAGRLDAWIIAEGIERPAELHTLAQLGVPLAQGFYLANPAPAWPELTNEVSAVLSMLPNIEPAAVAVGPLVEPCASCDRQSEWPPGVAACVRVESSMRPVALRVVDENGGEHVREQHELLRVKRASSLSAVALRSAARPERLRWDPIVCVDELGHFEGLIYVHKLVRALASQESGRPSQNVRPYDDVSAKR